MAKGGLTKGKSHAEGGIKMKVKSTGQNIEVEGGEVIINKKNVADPTKLEFEGEQKTTCEILSDLNSRNGNGVTLECDSVEGKKYKYQKGGRLPKGTYRYKSKGVNYIIRKVDDEYGKRWLAWQTDDSSDWNDDKILDYKGKTKTDLIRFLDSLKTTTHKNFYVDEVVEKFNEVTEKGGFMNCELFCNRIYDDRSFKEFDKLPFNGIGSLRTGDVLQFGSDSNPRHYAIYLSDDNVLEVEGWGSEPRKYPLSYNLEEYEEISAIYRLPFSAKRGGKLPKQTPKAKLEKVVKVEWVKNIGEEGWSAYMDNENAYENEGGYVSKNGNWKIFRDGKFYERDWGDNYERRGDWQVYSLNKYGRVEEYYGNFKTLSEAKNYVDDWIRINPKDYDFEYILKNKNTNKTQTPKSDLQKALKGIEVAIEIGGETKDLLKAKEGIEMALKLI